MMWIWGARMSMAWEEYPLVIVPDRLWNLRTMADEVKHLSICGDKRGRVGSHLWEGDGIMMFQQHGVCGPDMALVGVWEDRL